VSRSLPLLLGHRGDPRAHPENTMAGFASAVACGADGVELDVHASSDGVPVVIHDATLDRTTAGHGAVAAHTWQELDALGVPALPAVLRALRDHVVAVELKPPQATHPELAAAVLDCARDAGAARVMLLSFDHAHLVAARGADCVALVSELPADPLAVLDACGAETLAVWSAPVDAALCDRLHAGGRKLFAGPVDDGDDALAMTRIGVDGLISNRPCAVAERLRARPAAEG